MSNFEKAVGKAFVKILNPLSLALVLREEFEMLMLELGWHVNIDASQFTDLVSIIDIIQNFQEIRYCLDNLKNKDHEIDIQKIETLISAISDTLNKIKSLKSADFSTLASPINQQIFWEDISESLVDYLIIKYLEKEHRTIFSLLHISGIINYTYLPKTQSDRVSYYKKEILWNNLVELFKSPKAHLFQLYKLDTQGQDIEYKKLLDVLERISLTFRLPAELEVPREDFHMLFPDSNYIQNKDIRELEIPIIDGVSPDDHTLWKIGGVIIPIPDNNSVNGPITGIAFKPLLEGGLSFQTWFSKSISFKISGGFEQGKSMLIKLYPYEIKAEFNFPETDFASEIKLSGNPEYPYLLIGEKDRTRIELEGFDLKLGIKGTLADPEFYFQIGTGNSPAENDRPKIRAVFEPGDGDNFIKKLISPEHSEISLAGNLRWSSKTGITFEGNAVLEYRKEINRKLGPITINTFSLALKGSNDSANIIFALGFSIKLRPLLLNVEEIGTEFRLEPKVQGDSSAIFDKLDTSFGFKPPSGIGLKIDAKGFSGGGYLYIDNNRYAGILNINFNNKINFTAIAIISTNLPGDKEGYSLLIIITADGFKPIQLGMGFTLNGIGGLLGLNRSMNTEALRAGIKTGTAERILFPVNPLENAELIISDLESIFPRRNEIFVFGPVGKLGWGSGTNLLTADIGLIIQVPRPVKISVLGVIKVIVGGDENKSPLVIKVNFLGTFEPEKKSIFFDASIFASRLMKFTLEGDMAFRLIYGDKPAFLLSVGGFHSAFQPPPLQLVNMKRLSVSILNKDKAKIFLECYFAVTSNTVQFGAYVEASFRALWYDIIGYLGFDALFQFNPFMFTFDVKAGFGVFRKGKEKMSVNVAFRLKGPAPWNVAGKVTFKILGVKVKLNFNKTFGKDENPTLPDVDVRPLLIEAINKNENWIAIEQSNLNDLVKIRELEATSSLVVNPFGAFSINQSVAPLKTKLEKYGNQKPKGANYFEITKIQIDSEVFENLTDIKSNFAPSEFKSMSEGQKLSSPSFRKYKSGVQLPATDSARHGNAVGKNIFYESILIDGPDYTSSEQSRAIDNQWMEGLRKNSSVGKSDLSTNRKASYLINDRKIRIQEEAFRIVKASDLAPYNTNFYSEESAMESLQTILANNPELEEELLVVSEYEIGDENLVSSSFGGPES